MPERSDLSLRGLAVGVAIIFGGIAVSLAAPWLVISRIAAANDAKPPAVNGPSLQTAPSQDLAAFLREKNRRLESRGPIEGDPRHVHIPIEEAMRRLANGR